MMLTTLMRVQKQLGILPNTVYYRLDAGPENWCHCVFGVFDLMFDTNPQLQELYVSRAAVGKTHNGLDRWFGYINQGVFGVSPGGVRTGVNIYTRDDFHKILHDSLQGKKDTCLLDVHIEDLLFSFDFWQLLKPHRDTSFTGYGGSGQVHVFRYRRLPGRGPPHVSYKYWWQSESWLPADGSSLRILKSRPAVNDLAASVNVAPWV